MRKATETVKAILFGMAVLVLFVSPSRVSDTMEKGNETFLRKRYSKMYLEKCRHKYEIIYNDENRGLDELTAKGDR